MVETERAYVEISLNKLLNSFQISLLNVHNSILSQLATAMIAIGLLLEITK